MVPTRDMKTFLTSTALIAFAISTALGDVPKKIPLYQFAYLWTESPFTSKPPPPNPPDAVNPLDDFTLTGIAPVPGGYRVTIISKKDPTVKEIISPDGDGPFKVISVNRNPGQTLGTTVVLSNGSMQGTVSFEPDLITLNSAPAPQQNPQGNPNLPPGVNNNQGGQNLPPGVDPNQANQGGQNAGPRPRIVPPSPQSGGNKSNNDKKNDNQRPDRR